MGNWTDKEIKYLKKHYETLAAAKIAAKLDRPIMGIYHMACELKLSTKRLTAEEIAYLKANYSTFKNFPAVLQQISLFFHLKYFLATNFFSKKLYQLKNYLHLCPNF